MVKLALLHIKVRASSLLEVIVAMVIIMIVFGMAMMIFTHVTQSSLSVKKMKAQAIINNLMLHIGQKDQAENQLVKIDDFNVEIKAEPVSNASGLKQINITAYDSNQVKVAQEQKLIIFRNE